MNGPSARSAIRILCLCALGVAAIALPPAVLRHVVPALSPFVSITTIVATRAIHASCALALPILLLVIRRRRGFCTYVCPVGWLVEHCGKARGAKACAYARVPALGPWLLLLTLGGALVASPLFLLLDPISMLAATFGAARPPFSIEHVACAALFACVLASGVAFPLLWCRRLCPLGAAQDLIAWARELLSGWLSANETQPTPSVILRGNVSSAPDQATDTSPLAPAMARRAFLGVGAGVAGGLGARLFSARANELSLRPPGAVCEATLLTLCLRCGHCAHACPTGVIAPDLAPSNVAGLLLPALHFDANGCLDTCNACGRACPSGAIAMLPLHEKNDCRIGIAQINQQDCLLRVEKECNACALICPRGACVESFSRESYSATIAVDPNACNGCGVCVAVCPPRAITVTRKQA